MRRISTPARVGTTLALTIGLLVAANSMPGAERAGAAGGPRCLGWPVTVVGTKGADDIKGTPRRDVILARGGDDRIEGKGGPDVICAGPGDDAVKGNRGGDRISGGPGSDLLLGDSGRDKLRGNKGDDLLGGGRGKPDLCGGGPGRDLASKKDCERIRGATGV